MGVWIGSPGGLPSFCRKRALLTSGREARDSVDERSVTKEGGDFIIY
jgi:hypothetical protein